MAYPKNHSVETSLVARNKHLKQSSSAAPNNLCLFLKIWCAPRPQSTCLRQT